MNSGFKEGLDIQETQFGGPPLSISLPQQRRVIHFSSGETLEDDSVEEDEEEEEVLREPAATSWRSVALVVGRRSIRTFDFLGEKLAGLLGLNAAKYQYAIDEYHRGNKTAASKDKEGRYEKGVEKVHLSTRKGSEYGATKSLGVPEAQASNKNSEHRTGSHNEGYQDDDAL